jgi:hypothetical protein
MNDWRASLQSFGSGLAATARPTAAAAKRGDATRYHRRDEPRGPLVVFGYDYFAEHARAAGYAYEALNFADGRHTAQQIAQELSAEYGPVAVDLVLEYLQALQRIGVVE